MYEIWTKQNFKLKQIEETEQIKNIHLYKRGVYEFELNERPKCKICGSDLKFIKKGKRLIIDKCLNKNCETNNINLKKGAPIKWKAFLPNNILEQQHKNHVENNTYNLEFLINKKGFSLEEANEYINKHKQISSNSGKQNKGKSAKERIIKKLGSVEAAEKFIKEYNCFCKEYWLKRGYTEEEAIKNISEIQTKNSNKITVSSRRQASIRCKEHWIKIGYNEEESQKIISRYQTTFSKEICINKYGKEKGLEIFKKRQEKWQLTLYKTNKMHCGYSKISQDLFNELIKHTNNEIYYGSLNREYTIYNKENKHIYAFDFTDLTNKKIIEFQGDIYHANPNLFSEDDKPSPWNNLTSKELWQKDEYKKQVALNNNFDLIQIWESDFRNNKEKTIKKCLNFLNYE